MPAPTHDNEVDPIFFLSSFPSLDGSYYLIPIFIPYKPLCISRLGCGCRFPWRMTIISEHKGVINFHLTTREDGNELWKKIGSTSLSWVAAGTHNGLMCFLNTCLFVCLFVCFKGYADGMPVTWWTCPYLQSSTCSWPPSTKRRWKWTLEENWINFIVVGGCRHPQWVNTFSKKHNFLFVCLFQGLG